MEIHDFNSILYTSRPGNWSRTWNMDMNSSLCSKFGDSLQTRRQHTHTYILETQRSKDEKSTNRTNGHARTEGTFWYRCQESQTERTVFLSPSDLENMFLMIGICLDMRAFDILRGEHTEYIRTHPSLLGTYRQLPRGLDLAMYMYEHKTTRRTKRPDPI